MGTTAGPPAGALTQMWRAVYRKAAEAAEGRLQALLREHVYAYHLGAGGGGGALVLVATVTVAGTTTDLVEFATIPGAGAALLLVVNATVHVPGGSGGAEHLLLHLNDDATTNYWMKIHTLYGTTAFPPPIIPTAHAITADDASFLNLGPLGYTDSTDPDVARGSIVAWFPGHGTSGRRKEVLANGAAFTGPGTGSATHHLGQYGGEWRGTAPITKLSLYPAAIGSGTFAAGSTFSLYVLGA
jgi:hypothetical protein